MKELIFASNNAHKLEEVRALLPDVRVLSLSEAGFSGELPETSGTIKGNAIQKARFLYEKLRKPCFSDDTGLEVEALGGLPGVDTAHYAGLERDSVKNMNKLLEAMRDVENRKARFITVIALMVDEELRCFEGVVNGVVAHSRFGSGGFGYDPVFVPEGFDKTFAELPASVKQEISHRARALKQLSQWFGQMDKAKP